jgi:hypothetical protein
MQCSELLADRSSCRSGVFTQSRPGAAVTSHRPREPHSLRQPESPADVPYGEREIHARNLVHAATIVKLCRCHRDVIGGVSQIARS